MPSYCVNDREIGLIHRAAFQHRIDQDGRSVQAVEIEGQAKLTEFDVSEAAEPALGGGAAHFVVQVRPVASGAAGAVEDEFMEVWVSHNGGYYNRPGRGRFKVIETDLQATTRLCQSLCAVCHALIPYIFAIVSL